VVCDNHEVAINIKNISSIECDQYRSFLKNYSHLKKNIGNSRLRRFIIEEMFQQLVQKDGSSINKNKNLNEKIS
jgi:hypothetical protein